MSRTASIRLRGIVRDNFSRNKFKKIALNGAWAYSRTKTFKEFAEKHECAEDIPTGELSYCDEWIGCDKEREAFERIFDPISGLWQFACTISIKNDTSILDDFTNNMIPFIFKEVMHYEICIEDVDYGDDKGYIILDKTSEVNTRINIYNRNGHSLVIDDSNLAEWLNLVKEYEEKHYQRLDVLEIERQCPRLSQERGIEILKRIMDTNDDFIEVYKLVYKSENKDSNK